MNEFLQASFIAAGLTALLGVVLADDFYLKNGEIKGTGQKRIANTKRWELLKVAWDEGEVLEAIALRFLQNIAVLPILYLLYQANNKMKGGGIYLIAVLLLYLIVEAKSVFSVGIGVILFTGLLVVGRNIIYELKVNQVFITTISYTICIYWLLLTDYQEEGWLQIIKSFVAFEVKEWLTTILVYLILYKLDALPIWNISVGVKVLIILAIVQLPIPIYKIWGRVLK